MAAALADAAARAPSTDSGGAAELRQARPPQLFAPLRVKAVVLGGQGAGKTSLTQRMLGAAQLLSSPLPTVGVDFAARSVLLEGSRQQVRLHLWDASGQERFASLVEANIVELESYDFVVAVYDTTKAESLEVASEHIRRALRLSKGSPQVALVGSKADLEHREVSLSIGELRAQELGASIFVEVACPSLTASGRPSSHQFLQDHLVQPLLQLCCQAAPPSTPRPPPPRWAPSGAALPEAGNVRKCGQPLFKCLGLV